MVFLKNLLDHRQSGVEQVTRIHDVDPTIVESPSHNTNVVSAKIAVSQPPRRNESVGGLLSLSLAIPVLFALLSHCFKDIVADQLQAPKAHSCREWANLELKGDLEGCLFEIIDLSGGHPDRLLRH